MGIIALGAPTAVGNALIPPEGPAAIPLSLDFTSSGQPSYSINVGDFMQKGPGYPGLSILQTIYADLANAEAALVVEVSATGQRLVIPPQTQGYYPIISPSRDSISFACADTNAFVGVYLMNVPVPPNSWPVNAITAGIQDAPKDGNEYVRQNGEWVELSQSGGGSGGIADAPNDNKAYVRKAGGWAQAPIQIDAPTDGNFYGRTNGQWAEGSASSGSSSGGSSGSGSGGSGSGSSGGGTGSGSGSGSGSGGSTGTGSGTGAASGAPSQDAWNAGAVGNGPAATISNGGLTATADNPQGWSSVQGTNVYKAAQGKIYWEYKVSQGYGDGFIGAMGSGANASDYPGDASGFGRGYDGNTHTAWGGQVTNGSGWAAGDVIGFALDLAAGNLSIYHNNTADGGVTGMTIPAAGIVLAAGFHSASGQAVTMATTSAECKYQPPSGFSFAAAVPGPGQASDNNGHGYHKYWAAFVSNMPSGGYGIGDLQMYDDAGNALCQGTETSPGALAGTAIAEGTYGTAGFDQTKAFDNSLDSFWCGTSDPAYLGWEFNVPVNVNHMVVTNRNTSDGYGCAFPPTLQVKYSDDGVTWTAGAAGLTGCDNTSEKAWNLTA